MADGKIEMDYDGFRSAGHHLQSLSESVRSSYQTFLSATEGRGEPWGHDKFGKSFAEGKDKYKESMESLKKLAEGDGGDGYIEALDEFGKNILNAADQIESKDNDEGRNIQQVDKQTDAATPRYTLQGAGADSGDAGADGERMRLPHADFGRFGRIGVVTSAAEDGVEPPGQADGGVA
ncbi:hypothetical protein Srot_0493 [Segniliparus rotundus DSM 44985]|uniref:Uncharacterized protein n=1 Tax=Segniliparus rotundus (strain ATCC BAA-972 / CDC 1076 / CIP 108378 / DSM 44985 / JCM 13578) TaxID=640132 RepID=D6ZC03_SEGRD|nr:hypothetical protein [Segniliparus rotundus]ADG96980.1 hypothetical protein Srot_0493 [Segniliparus rotundus DSM 44985]